MIQKKRRWIASWNPLFSLLKQTFTEVKCQTAKGRKKVGKFPGCSTWKLFWWDSRFYDLFSFFKKSSESWKLKIFMQLKLSGKSKKCSPYFSLNALLKNHNINYLDSVLAVKLLGNLTRTRRKSKARHDTVHETHKSESFTYEKGEKMNWEWTQ